MMAKISHINLSVSNINQSIAFYDALLFPLGFRKGLDEKGDWGSVRGYKGDGIELEIIHENDIAYGPFNRFVGLNHICFEAQSMVQVDELYAVVKKLGVKITRPPKKYPEYSQKYYAFYFRDPDGIPFEVALV